MKYIIFIFLFSGIAFSQGNYNVEWESPAGKFFYYFAQSERNNSIPEIILKDGSNNYHYYDGATKQEKYYYADADSFSFGQINYISTVPFDINNDNMYDFTRYKSTGTEANPHLTVQIMNAATDQPFWTGDYNYHGYPTMAYDIDGDGFIELCLELYKVDNSGHTIEQKVVIISTPAHVIGIENLSQVPAKYDLKQNYPNPFNPSTKIEYSVSKAADVSIIIYDVLGQVVRTLDEGKVTGGSHKIDFDGTNLASGSYFYQLVVDGVPDAKKMTLLK